MSGVAGSGTDPASGAGAGRASGPGSNGGPLAGIRVVEICTTIAGPVCTRLMADFGAEVIKIEPHEGDPVRHFGAVVEGASLYGASILRNKSSIAVDLKRPEGRRIALELIGRADVLVENNRPGVMERLGLGWAELSAVNPGLVMVRISGYGQDGPYANRPGYGAICEAVGGVRHMTGDPDRPPARVALATTDYLTAVYSAFGALVALRSRDRTGRGQVVDAALYEAAFTQMEAVVPEYDKLGTVPMRQGPNLPSFAPNSLYPSRDGGWVLIAANSKPTFERLAVLMKRPDLLEDPRFSSIRARGEMANVRVLDALVAEWSRTIDALELEESLHAAEVPSARVYTIADIFADPQYQARGMLVSVPHPSLGHTVQMGVVPRLSGTPGAILRTGCEVGADTDRVLGRELGYPQQRIDELHALGVVSSGANQ
ncbi:MAG: CoA transferase [Burkholderiaceae bacterium]|nr:CoA transferase [Burkholderiaceae bacterium]